jgi:hypothetical protein
MDSAATAECLKEHEAEYRMDKNTYTVSTYFKTRGAPSVQEKVEALLKERAIRTFAKPAR